MLIKILREGRKCPWLRGCGSLESISTAEDDHILILLSAILSSAMLFIKLRKIQWINSNGMYHLKELQELLSAILLVFKPGTANSDRFFFFLCHGVLGGWTTSTASVKFSSAMHIATPLLQWLFLFFFTFDVNAIFELIKTVILQFLSVQLLRSLHRPFLHCCQCHNNVSSH